MYLPRDVCIEDGQLTHSSRGDKLIELQTYNFTITENPATGLKM